ncbi:sulfurtransferase TusA family protein [Agarilytica rhodophyticola]|uniref:sulfurtransferase TusA family protein n=1 Tax=Agarilytica rhodophyticola TaxID=1737490 RepID=UPI000B343011|nr:sulfurtransferase TusA family protein [Agarilytica rhodophyticola]
MTISENFNPKITVDAQGLSCPMPLLKAKQALNQVEADDIVCVIASDAGSVRDFHSFADLTEHKIVDFCDENGIYTYTIRKGKLV